MIRTFYFVRCPADGKLHFSMHPHIHHVCSCGAQLGYNLPEQDHTILKAGFRARTQKEWTAKFEDMQKNPEKYLTNA